MVKSNDRGPMWMQIARDELGKLGTDYAAALTTTLAGVPSAFVSWCLEVAGEKSTKSPVARGYLKWGKAVSDYPIGAVVVVLHGEKPWQCVVGFIDTVSQNDLRLVVALDDGKPCLLRFPKSRILGVRWPNG